jgi:hypothetical protein
MEAVRSSSKGCFYGISERHTTRATDTRGSASIGGGVSPVKVVDDLQGSFVGALPRLEPGFGVGDLDVAGAFAGSVDFLQGREHVEAEAEVGGGMC